MELIHSLSKLITFTYKKQTYGCLYVDILILFYPELLNMFTASHGLLVEFLVFLKYVYIQIYTTALLICRQR